MIIPFGGVGSDVITPLLAEKIGDFELLSFINYAPGMGGHCYW
jgi:hypothetical protein